DIRRAAFLRSPDGAKRNPGQVDPQMQWPRITLRFIRATGHAATQSTPRGLPGAAAAVAGDDAVPSARATGADEPAAATRPGSPNRNFDRNHPGAVDRA